MVNLLKNSSTQGLYLLEEENGQIANNTPGEIDLDNLTLGTMYIYFDTVLRFQEKSSFDWSIPDWAGFHTWQTGDNAVQASTTGGTRTFYIISVEHDETTAENLKRIASLNVINNTTTAQGKIKHLVKQTASEAFEKFPNSSVVNINSTAIIIRAIDIVEMAERGKDLKVSNITCERITFR